MTESSQRLSRLIWTGFGMTLALVALLCLFWVTEFSGAKQRPLPAIDQISDFTLTNQNNQVITLADLTNHVWVADIIFTRCAGSCPIMSTKMKSLQAALPPASDAKLVTLTCNPDYDTPEKMKKYGERYDADFNRWMFLTGTTRELSGLATTSLKLGATPVLPKDRTYPDDFFVHSTIFVVVDKQARLRGIFQTEGQGVNWETVKPQILATVKELEGG